MANPRRSVELLDELEALGFTNEAFRRLHHSRVRNWRKPDSISRHRSYCEGRSSFQRDGDAERDQRRLEFVLQKYRAGGFPPGRLDIFNQLADAAFAEIPPFKTVGKRAPFKSTDAGV